RRCWRCGARRLTMTITIRQATPADATVISALNAHAPLRSAPSSSHKRWRKVSANGYWERPVERTAGDGNEPGHHAGDSRCLVIPRRRTRVLPRQGFDQYIERLWSRQNPE